jgi:hypothetical protein
VVRHSRWAGGAGGSDMVDRRQRGHTVCVVDVREIRSRLLPTPFFTSFIGRARPGALDALDPVKRAAAWASWAVENATEVRGYAERSYYALGLPGRFYDPKGTGPHIKPHLEIPARVLAQADAMFPERLAHMGNGLLFPWWVASEVTAARRALFNTAHGSPETAMRLIDTHQGSIRDAVDSVNAVAAGRWDEIQGLLASTVDGLSGDATGDFSAEDVAAFFPAARPLHLSVAYDVRLREKNGVWASRRVGVWQISGVEPDGERFSYGVLTPRLTANSLFSDELFQPKKESSSALLVRGLLLKRLADRHLGGAEIEVGPAAGVDARPPSYLRAVPARVGAKLPEASVAAAVHFLQTYPDPEKAFGALEEWAGRSGAVLTVLKDGYIAAHRRAQRFLRRAEELERDDVDVLLPLAWDDKNRVVRVTFVRAGDE